MLAGLPKEIEEYVIPADETCSVCGGDLKIIGKRLIRLTPVYDRIHEKLMECQVLHMDETISSAIRKKEEKPAAIPLCR